MQQQQQQQHSPDFGNCTTQLVPNVVLSQQLHLQLEQRQQLHQRQLQLQQTQLQEQQQIILESSHCTGSTVMPVSTSWTSCITSIPPPTPQNIGEYRLSEEEGAQLAEIEEDLKRSAEYKLVSFLLFFDLIYVSRKRYFYASVMTSRVSPCFAIE